MKTKIIYISGGEKFNMTDVRTAFEEVRTALALGPDTVMFGVPVDTDDALESQMRPANEATDTISNSEPDAEPVIEPIAEPEAPAPKKRGRKKIEAVEPDESETESVDELVPDTESVEEKVVPILSVLGGTSDNQPDESENVEEEVEENNEENSQEPEIDESEPEIIVETETTITDDGIEINSESVSIQEVIADEPPVAETEDTLEQLLEKMTPLSEDIEETSSDEISDEEIVSPVDPAEDETLQRLATEFIENQDKIINTTKSGGRGKIGKLKNILPFKKAKHEESGIMGDLFGWAGIAANDEEFSMPGFLGLGSKK